MLSYAAVIFDLDGTLIDSEPVFQAVAKITANEFDKCFTDELYISLVGLPGVDVERGILKAFGRDFPLEDFRRRFEARWSDYVATNGIAQKPGAAKFVERLDALEIPYAIATSTPHLRAQQSLDFAGLGGRFKTLVGGDQVENGKPAPDIYIRAANEIDTAPRHCIAVEDSKVGVRSASSANMYTIMIPDIKAPDNETRSLASEILVTMDAASDHITMLISE